MRAMVIKIFVGGQKVTGNDDGCVHAKLIN